MRFQFSISHVPGKSLTTADALSRAPSSEPLEGDKLLQDEADVYVNMVVKALPATERQIQQHQEKDEVCRQIAVYCYHGWPKEKRSQIHYDLTFLLQGNGQLRMIF